MMGQTLPSDLEQALAQGTTLLTPNERSARILRRAYARSQIAAGLGSWTPPQILSLETWLQTLWHQRVIEGYETRLLLNPVQQHTLWRQIIESDREVSGLRSPDSLAQLAAAAFHQLHRYNGRGRLRDHVGSTDSRAFERWTQAFDRLCTRDRFITPAQLPRELEVSSFAGDAGPASRLALVDFDHLAPAFATLPATHIQTQVSPESATLYPAPDAATELRAAAQWAVSILFESPQSDIAIIVPNLADLRGQIDRVFHPILGETQYEFSLGRPLAETELASTALHLLRWPLEPLPLETISALLLSPFLTTGAEAANFDAQVLRQATLLRPELSLEGFLQILGRKDWLPSLGRALRALKRTASDENLLPSAPGVEGPRQSHAGWADAFRTLLDGAGWSAATSSADSLTFQTRRAWESALDTLSTLDFDGALVSASAALESLTRIARNAVFAPESRNAPVQIMGPLEFAGLPCDALWFLGADDQSWPLVQSSNPLIPWQLRRELGIPGSDPTHDDTLARIRTQRLAQSAPHVVFSYAERDENGHRRPSPLLHGLNLTTAGLSAAGPEFLPLETIPDSEPLPEVPFGTLIRGGARVLELQSACAFRAFAEFRLRSTEPDSRTLGLDARDSGIQVHRIMETFWTQLQTQEALKSLPRGDRDTLLNDCIEASLARLGKTSSNWEAAYLEVQRKRLRALLNPWLDFETTRAAFTVRQQELKELSEIGPLTLDLRADRIDQTASGAFLIDYKTGLAAPGDWLTDRPGAPQLPLYAVHAAVTRPEEPIAGLAFALLRAGDGLALTGFTDDPALISKPGKMPWPSIEEMVEDWHRVLSGLAEAFAQSDPILNPKDYPNTCKRCTQRILCRLDPTKLNVFDEELEGSDA